MSRSSLPFMLLWAVLHLAPVQAWAEELHGRVSPAFSTTEDPEDPTTRFLVAYTDHANNNVKVGSWTSAGGHSCGSNGFVSTTTLPTTAGGNSVVARSSVSISRSGLLAVTLFTDLDPVVGHIHVLNHDDSTNDSCAGWSGSWVDIANYGSDIPISAPSVVSILDSGLEFEYVGVEIRNSGGNVYYNVAYRVDGGDWAWNLGLGSYWNSQPALAVFGSSLYVFGRHYGEPWVGENHGSLDLGSSGTGAPTWSNSGYATYVPFVDNSDLYAPTGCSATANTTTILVACGDNSSPMHYWANV